MGTFPSGRAPPGAVPGSPNVLATVTLALALVLVLVLLLADVLAHRPRSAAAGTPPS